MCFNPRAPCGARPVSLSRQQPSLEFQSTRPMRGATSVIFGAFKTSMRFNPRAPCGARPRERGKELPEELFQSTRPMRGATFAPAVVEVLSVVSIHAPHAGRDLAFRCILCRCPVSIHAPHAGRDAPLMPNSRSIGTVSIHAPHAGRDSKRGHDFPPLPRIYGYSPPQIRFSRHLRPTPLLRHDSRTYIFTFCFLFTSPSHSVMNTQMMIAASKS